MFTFNLVGFKCCYFSLLNQQITYRLTSQNVSLISEIFSNSIEYPFISRFGKACSQASLHSTQRLLPFFVKFFLGKTTLEKSLMCALSYWTKTMKILTFFRYGSPSHYHFHLLKIYFNIYEIIHLVLVKMHLISSHIIYVPTEIEEFYVVYFSVKYLSYLYLVFQEACLIFVKSLCY